MIQSIAKINTSVCVISVCSSIDRGDDFFTLLVLVRTGAAALPDFDLDVVERLFTLAPLRVDGAFFFTVLVAITTPYLASYANGLALLCGRSCNRDTSVSISGDSIAGSVCT